MPKSLTPTLIFFFGIVALPARQAHAAPREPTVGELDVVVVGGSSGGSGAALGAARLHDWIDAGLNGRGA